MNPEAPKSDISGPAPAPSSSDNGGSQASGTVPPPRPAARPAGPRPGPPRRPQGSPPPAGGNGTRPPPQQQATGPSAMRPRPRPPGLPRPSGLAPASGPPARPAAPASALTGPPARPRAAAAPGAQLSAGPVPRPARQPRLRPPGPIAGSTQPQPRPPPPPTSQQAAAAAAAAAARAIAQPVNPAALQPAAGKAAPAAAAPAPAAAAPAAQRPPPPRPGSSSVTSKVPSTSSSARAATPPPRPAPSQPADDVAARQPPAEADGDEPAGSSGGGGGSSGGWGGGWGLGGWGSALREAAAIVTKDVSELTTSFQAALAEVEDSDDEQAAHDAQQQQPRRGGAPSQPQPPGAGASARGRPPPGAAAASMQTKSGGDSDAARRRVLASLEGKESQLETGLKTIDKHVDQLAGGALQKVSGLWGGATGMWRTAAQSLSETVEEGVRDVSSLHAVKAASGSLAAVAGNSRRVGAQLASEAESRLEAIGKQAFELLEAPRGAVWGAAQRVAQGSGRQAPGFEAAFATHDGRQTFEELEEFCNNAARRCNRVRAAMDAEGRAALEAALAELPPALDMASADTPRASGRSAAADRGHAPVTTLCIAAKEAAEELTKAAQAAAADAPSPAQPASEEVDDGAAFDSASPEAIDPAAVAKKQLDDILTAGSERLGEISALCIERVLALAKSVGAYARFRQPSDDGIKWPATPQATAVLLCVQAKRMEADVLAIASAFSTALHSAAGALSGIADVESFYNASSAALEKDAATAIARLQESLRGLMYVVLLTSVDQELL